MSKLACIKTSTELKCIPDNFDHQIPAEGEMFADYNDADYCLHYQNGIRNDIKIMKFIDARTNTKPYIYHFVTREEPNKPLEINDYNFSRVTSRRFPYCQRDPNNKKYHYYAYCPICKKPIELFSLYKYEHNTCVPHGIHLNDLGLWRGIE